MRSQKPKRQNCKVNAHSFSTNSNRFEHQDIVFKKPSTQQHDQGEQKVTQFFEKHNNGEAAEKACPELTTRHRVLRTSLQTKSVVSKGICASPTTHQSSVISQQLSIINHRSQLIARLEAIAGSSPRITQLPPNYRPTTTDPLAHPEEARVARLIIVCD